MLFLLSGASTAVIGITASIFWTFSAGIIALLAMGLIIIFVIVLQRKQLAILQQRVLALIRTSQALEKERILPEDGEASPLQETMEIRKIFDLLQAQQISIELLNDKLESLQDKSTP